MTRAAAVFVVLALAAADLRAQDFLETMSERLAWQAADGGASAQATVFGDLTVYHADEPAPGLLFTDDATFVAPRLVVLLDANVGRIGAHVQARADRGFDPGLDRHGDLRLDEYYLQADLLDAWRMRLRVGKFATAFGGWVERHQAWDNPLISAPALYEDMLPITDVAGPPSLAGFAGRRDAPENKATWVPIVWGPSYSTGASLAAGTDAFDLLLEVKNASLSSRPGTWNEIRDGFDTGPTYTGRIAYRPSFSWTLGASVSRGPYLQTDAAATLPAGTGLGDFDQTTFAVDLTYELHQLQVWAELARVGFEVPRVGEVKAVAGFIEARYKLAPQLWLAGRWNHSRFDDTPGLDRSWDRDLNRFDLAVGYRFGNHLQAKLEYGHWAQRGGNTMGRHTLAAQVALWF